MDKLKTLIGISDNKTSGDTFISYTTASTPTNVEEFSTISTVQSFCLVWLDSNIDENHNYDSINTIKELRRVVSSIEKFTDIDECIHFLKTMENKKILLISSGRLGRKLIPIIHDMVQINSIYIFCQYQKRHEKWTKKWLKIQGVYTTIEPICEALKEIVHDCDQNLIEISLVRTTNENFDRFNQSLIYTQILKEILLDIDFQQEHIHEFCQYCREQFRDNNAELENVEKFEREYKRYDPIWWYTNDSFLYSMLNRALRLTDIDLIIKMGFFIRDLHNYIIKLYSEQYNRYHSIGSFTVYRGQGLSHIDFDQLKNTQNGLISFNNFLSTSKNYNTSLKFAQRMIATTDLIGVLFVMQIDPLVSTTPYANVRIMSVHQDEDEILFSMHCTFRMEEIKSIRTDNRLWQVNLTLINNNETEIQTLTQRLRDETKGSTGWLRLTKFLIKLEQYNEAKELLKKLLLQTTDERDKEEIHSQLQSIETKQKNYT